MKKLITLLILYSCSLLSQEPLQWLSTKKTAFVNEKGEPFVFRGINVGSWLAVELWMLPLVITPPSNTPYSTITDHVTLWQTLESRFGHDKMEEIRTQFRHAWIQDQDFANIKRAGFNTIRLPFLYDLHHEPKGLFYWLDHAVELAKKHGLYIILDMHGVYGRQSQNMHTGEVNKDKFFTEKHHLEATCSLWKEIARRYKDCPNIAGYDLVNEPMSAPSKRELYKMYDKIYKAIRSEDSRHIIFMQDGYKGVTSLPPLKDYKWSHVAISTHHYFFGASDEKVQKLQDHLQKVDEMQKKLPFPHYLGEFNVAPQASFSALEGSVKLLHDKNVSYSFWSYKIGRRGHNKSLWAIYYAPGRQKNIDPFRDKYKVILKKIALLKTRQYEKNRDHIEIFTQGSE